MNLTTNTKSAIRIHRNDNKSSVQCSHLQVIEFSDLVDLWVIKIKKAYDPLRAL